MINPEILKRLERQAEKIEYIRKNVPKLATYWQTDLTEIKYEIRAIIEELKKQ